MERHQRKWKLTGELEFERFDTEEITIGTHLLVIEAEKSDYLKKCVLM